MVAYRRRTVGISQVRHRKVGRGMIRARERTGFEAAALQQAMRKSARPCRHRPLCPRAHLLARLHAETAGANQRLRGRPTRRPAFAGLFLPGDRLGDQL